MNTRLKKIMEEIIKKGGLYGKIAQQYVSDEKMAQQFIKECREQTHNGTMQKFWGSVLVSEINLYCEEAGLI